MKKPVIAIGLDSADPNIIEKWMVEGHLKNISKIRQQGTYGRLYNTVNYSGVKTETKITERMWGTFLTGCLPNKTGYWGPIQFQEGTYEIKHDYKSGAGAYNFEEYPLFFALGDKYKVATFDVPGEAISPQVNGIQILGWGGHAPCTPSISSPSEVLPDIIKKYGKNSILNNDHGFWWDENYFNWIQKTIEKGLINRTAICKDLLSQEDWDLFMMVFAESHTAGHDFWHLSQKNSPFYPVQVQKIDSDPMLESFKKIDDAIGEILKAGGEDASVVIFSLHGMANNITDLSSMMFLPELMYRYNFPGKYGFAKGKMGITPPQPTYNPRRKSWSGEIWQQRHDPNVIKRFLRKLLPSKFDKYLRSDEIDIASPYQMLEKSSPLFWMPAMWYQPLWPQMKAFALPSVGSGHIRINLKGRESQGIVDPNEYDALCNDIAEHLYQIRDARTGKLLVKQVVRTRESSMDNDPKLTDADLVVVYNEDPQDQECMTDVIDSPTLGRIGPVTYSRFGGHRPRGFVIAKGSEITPGSTLPEGNAVDLAPTILHLMGAPIPEYMDGKSLVADSSSKSRLPVNELQSLV